MRSFKAFAFVTVASVLLAGSLQAQWKGRFNWGGSYSGTGAYYKNSVSNRVWNTASSPYYASFSGVVANPSGGVAEANWYLPPSGTTVDIFCVDLLHTAGSYDANFTNLANTSFLGVTTRNSSQAKYLKAAYLAQKIGRRANYGTPDVKNMTGAIWQIMTGASPLDVRRMGWSTTGSGGPYNYDAVAAEVLDAERNYGRVNAADWVVVTDRGSVGPDGGSQEHLTQVTPEPATMLLLGTGLVVMLMAAGALRRPMA